jgi:hypothetical protein
MEGRFWRELVGRGKVVHNQSTHLLYLSSSFSYYFPYFCLITSSISSLCRSHQKTNHTAFLSLPSSNNLTTVRPLVWITSYWNKPLTRDGSSPYILQLSNFCRFPHGTYLWRSCLVRSTCIFFIPVGLHLKLLVPTNDMLLSRSWYILSICRILNTHRLRPSRSHCSVRRPSHMPLSSALNILIT